MRRMLMLTAAMLIAAQAYGETYSSPRTGKVDVTGPFLKKYRQMGAQRGALGFPVSEARPTPGGGRQMLFEHGAITVSRSGAVEALALPTATFTANAMTVPPGSATVRQIEGGTLLQLKGSMPARELYAYCVCTQRRREFDSPRMCPRPEVSQPFTLRCDPSSSSCENCRLVVFTSVN